MYWFIKCMKQYFDFSGRARRKEFWMFNLILFLFSMIAAVIDKMIGGYDAAARVGPITTILSIATLIPSLAVAVRRLHDIGKSGWTILIGLIPVIGGIILLVWYCSDSEEGINEWGENPKGGNELIYEK